MLWSWAEQRGVSITAGGCAQVVVGSEAGERPSWRFAMVPLVPVRRIIGNQLG
jgi:hypothetical protein